MTASVVNVDQNGRFMFVRPQGEDYDVYVPSAVLGRGQRLPRQGDQGRVQIVASDRGPKGVSWEDEPGF